MALPATDPEERLLALIRRAEPRLRTALLNAIIAAKGTTTLRALADLIEAGRFEEALTAAANAGAIRLADEAAAVFTVAGREGAKFLSDVLDITVGFDQVNVRAVNVMQEERLRLIREFTAEQRRATRAALVEGIRRGANPVEQARDFRASIGLTEKQQAAVVNFRRLLEANSAEALTRELRDRRFDRTVRRAIRDGEPLTAAQIDRMVGRYRERSIKFRAETIARTEALRAVHAGNDEVYRQAIDEGLLDLDQLQRMWNTARDERVRGSHRGLNGLIRGMDETFPGINGALRFPGDPRAPASETVKCRCALSTRIDAPDEGRIAG